jgi:hypothetical protein
MAYYAVTSESDELIPLSDLVFPVRIYFIVSDSDEGEQLSFPVSYYNITNQVVSETFNLPFVYEMSGKYFYSFIQNAVASLQSEEETPTPTITPTIHNCATSPVTITVSSEYEASTNTRTYKYTTSDSDGNGGLFGCINAERGSTLTIFVDGDEPNLVSHPIKITEFRNDGHHGTPRNDVTRIDLTEGQTEDHTYALTWVLPCDETIDKYQYQCEHHSHMRGTINVIGECPTPTPEKTPTPLQPTPTPTPEQTPTPTPEQTPTPTPEQTPTPTPEQTPTPTPEQTPTPTPEQTPTPTPEQTPTPTPEQTPTPTPEQTPTPTPLQPTPTPEEDKVDQNSDGESECINGYTINNNEIYRGIQLKYSSGQIIVDAKEYTPSPSVPTLIYIYIGSTETENFCGRITVNSRVDGISNSTFNNTIISYVHSNGKCYNKDINGIIGNDNYIVFGEEDEETTNAIQSCCSNLQVISSKSSNNYGIRLSDSDGMICVDPKNYTHSFGLPVVVYIYINNYTQYGETYRGKITFQNRLNGLGEDSFNSDNLIYIDSDNKCYNIKLSEVNELNNIKIFNTYN